MSGCEGSDFSIEYRTGTQYSLLPKESHWRKCEVTINRLGRKRFLKSCTSLFFICLKDSFVFFFCIHFDSWKTDLYDIYAVYLFLKKVMLAYAGVYNCKCYFCSLPNGKYTQRHLLETCK